MAGRSQKNTVAANTPPLSLLAPSVVPGAFEGFACSSQKQAYANHAAAESPCPAPGVNTRLTLLRHSASGHVQRPHLRQLQERWPTNDERASNIVVATIVGIAGTVGFSATA
jgi:hypothetical protein